MNVKRIQASSFDNHMLKEPTEVSFFAIQTDLPFFDTNFTEEKFDKDPLK